MYNTEEKNEDQITAILSLLNMGIKTVPEGVLKMQFNDVTMKMLHILREYSTSENNTIIKSIFGILSAVLRTQELAMWHHTSTIQIFNAILNPFCIHSKPKVVTVPNICYNILNILFCSGGKRHKMQQLL